MRTGKLQSAAGYEHAFIPALPWAAGRVYYTPAAPNAISSFNLPAGRTIYQPFFIPPGSALPNRVVLQVNPSAYSSGNVRLALYSEGGGVPGALIEDLGNRSVATTGNKSFSPSQDIPPGWVWVAFNHNGAGSGQFRTFAYAGFSGRGLVGARAGLTAATIYVDEDVSSGFPANANSDLQASSDHWPLIWMTRV